MKPHLIMPMAGAGSRFYKKGYNTPKPLIEINNRPFFYWATMSLQKFIDISDITFVVLQQHVNNFFIDKTIKKYFSEARIEVLPEILQGPVLTSMKGVKHICDEAPIIINDCDHLFKCSAINNIFNQDNFSIDGALLTFMSDEPQFSYVRYDGNGKIIGTVEKKVVSKHAICGSYIFKNAQIFYEASSNYIQNCPYNEYFMSGVYNQMCKNKMELMDYLVDYHLEFGTPEEYEKAKKSRYFNELI